MILTIFLLLALAARPEAPGPEVAISQAIDLVERIDHKARREAIELADRAMPLLVRASSALEKELAPSGLTDRRARTALVYLDRARKALVALAYEGAQDVRRLKSEALENLRKAREVLCAK